MASEVDRPSDGDERRTACSPTSTRSWPTIDAQHLHTRDHSENVAAYAVAIGQRLGLDRERIVRLRRAALLHDIGKVAVAARSSTSPPR